MVAGPRGACGTILGARRCAFAPVRENSHIASRPGRRRRRGLTLIEVVVSTLIVGVMTVAALNTLGAATRSSEAAGNRAVALGLADDLMAEILNGAYSEPSGAPVFGPESGENTGTRAAFDDVDDYHGWNRMPPQTRDGVNLPDRAEWRRRVVVERVVPTNPAQTTSGSTDQGAKRIRVIVEYQGAVLIEQIAVRTNFP